MMFLHFPTLLKALRLTFTRKPRSFRHQSLVIVFVFLFFLLRSLVWLLRGLDRLLFPKYREQPITNPIYIVGNPRSGTTFSHRLISRDPRFSYLKLYHTIFPSVICYKLFAVADKLDRATGRVATRILNRINNKAFKGWDSIHKTGPREAESDEMYFVYAMLSPLLGLLFPYLDQFPEALFADRLPHKQRQKLMAYYRDCLQRHMYATGRDKILLQKVALIAGRLRSIHETFPDMKIIHLVRHPYESLPSLVSMFYVPWTALAPQVERDSAEARAVADMILEYYQTLLEFKKELPPDQFIEVRYEELVADPEATVRRIYGKLNLELTDEYRTVLLAEAARARGYRSHHQYSLAEYGLSKDMIYERLKDVFHEYGFER